MIYDIIYKIDGICLYSSVSCRLARKVKFYGEWLMKMIWSVIYLVLVAILGHYIGELLPRKWFDYESFPKKTAPYTTKSKSKSGRARCRISAVSQNIWFRKRLLPA